MAHTEHVAFGLSLASSKLMHARMTVLESSSPLESVASLSYSSLLLSFCFTSCQHFLCSHFVSML